MAKCFLVYVTLLVIVLFLISIINIEELGKCYVGLVIFSILPLLDLAWIITICFDRNLD